MDSQASSPKRGLLVMAAALLCTLGFAASAHAMTTYNVTPGDATSLRNAIDAANADGDDSTVNVPAGHYTLNPTDPGFVIFNDGGTFTLAGAGARSTIIDGGGIASTGIDTTTEDPVFTIAAFCKCIGPATATVSGVTVTGGDSPENGGAFFIENDGPASLATLHLFDSTISGNGSANDGGGIFNEGVLDVQRVTFSNNFAEADGSAIATKSRGERIDVVTRGARGAPVDPNFAITTIVNSTFANNTSDSDTGCEGGGAVEQEDGRTTIVNSTIVGNTSNDGTCEQIQPTGGGIDIESGPASIVNTIVTGNTASPRLDVENSRSEQRITRGFGPAGPTVPSNCSVDTGNLDNPSSLTSLGHNIESATDCGFTSSGDQQNVADPGVGALGNNGGQMDTMALLAGSVAIDHADAANCPATDEIGTTRPQGPACDVGAYEVPVAAAAPPAPAAQPAAPKVGVAGVRRACVRGSFHVRFHIATAASVKSVTVKLDGKRIKSTKKSGFTLTINGKKLKAGRHRLTITATDSNGKATSTRKSFSVCKAAKPRRRAAPRFTG